MTLKGTDTVVLIKNHLAENFIKRICTDAQAVTIVIFHDFEGLL